MVLRDQQFDFLGGTVGFLCVRVCGRLGEGGRRRRLVNDHIGALDNTF